MGGAARFLGQLDTYLEGQPQDGVEVIGRAESITPRWLVKREQLRLAKGSSKVVALNNLSFLGGAHRTVLLRNALHFLTDAELRQIGGQISSRQHQTGRLARSLARRAHRIVVPSQDMANRVAASAPGLAERCVVMHHPFALPLDRTKTKAGDSFTFLCPVLNDSFKRLQDTLPALSVAIAETPTNSVLRLTLTAKECAEIGVRLGPHCIALGRLSSAQTSSELEAADCLVFPTTIESFGYPLAEARLLRIPVLAPATPLATEIADDCHVATDFGDPQSLRASLRIASELVLGELDNNPFDPVRYFDQLFAR